MRISDYFSLKRLWGLTKKEVAVLIKDKPAMIIIFMIPTTLIITTNLGRTGFVEPPRLGLVDLDNSEGTPNIDLSSEFISLAIDYHNQEEIFLVLDENFTLLQDKLRMGDLDAIIVLQDSMEYNISVGYPAIIEVQIDWLNVLMFQLTLEKVDNLVSEFKEVYDINGIFNPETTLFLRPKNASRLFDTAPFFFPWTLFSIATLVASQLIVSDVPKHRMALTPTNKFEISLSKVAGVQILLSGVAIELMILSFIFGLIIRSPIWIYFFVIWIISLAGVTLGFMLSTFAKTPLAALQFFIFFFLLQIIIIYFIPWDEILYIFPVYLGQFLFLNAIIRGQTLQMDVYLVNILIFILVTFILGYWKYRRLYTLV